MSEEIKNYMIKGDKRIDEIVVGIKKDADAQDSK